jgi:hypothetical protein
MLIWKKIRSGGIVICLLALAFTVPSATHSLTITSHLTSRVVENNGIHGFRSSERNTRNSLTATNSHGNGVGADEFKDINIDDVLLEADNALKAAQTSLVDDDDNVDGNTEGLMSENPFKDIDVDDVLLEAENALKLAQSSLIDNDENKKNGDTKLGNLKDAIRNSLLSDDIEDKTSVEVTEILSSTLGGILLGSLLGSVATFKLSDLGVLSFDDVQFTIPIIAGVVVGGIVGFAGSLQDNTAGMIVRNVLGVPTKALASAIVNNIQEAARRQVEKTTNELKSIPSNVAKEAKLAVDMAIESAIESAIEKLKKLVVVLAILASLAGVGVLILNEQLIVDMVSQNEQLLVDMVSQQF